MLSTKWIKTLAFQLSISYQIFLRINPKATWRGWGGGGVFQFDLLPLTNISSKEREKPWFFVTFNIIISHIFPEHFIEIPQFVQKIWRIYLSILAILNRLSSIFQIFWHTLVTKKLMTSAYNRWCHHFFTFNIL